jgi:hypothetical protein
VKENVNGLMEKNMLDNGEIIKWKEMELSLGQIIKNIKGKHY